MWRDCKCGDGFWNTEKFADEIFDMRREGDEEFGGVLLAFDGLGIRAALHQTIEEFDVGSFQVIEENTVQTGERVAVIKVFKMKAKGKVKRFCGSRHAFAPARTESPRRVAGTLSVY